MLSDKEIFSVFIDLKIKKSKELKVKIEEYGLSNIFFNLYDKLKLQEEEVDKLVYYIIFAYTNCSRHIVAYKDPKQNRIDIMQEVGIKKIDGFWKRVLKMDDEDVAQSVSRYLQWQHDSHWQIIMINHNWYTRNMMFVEEPIIRYKEVVYEREEKDKTDANDSENTNGNGQYTQRVEISQSEISELELKKKKLLDACMEKEKETRALISDYRQKYQNLDHMVKGDLGENLFSDLDTSSAEKLLENYLNK